VSVYYPFANPVLSSCCHYAQLSLQSLLLQCYSGEFNSNWGRLQRTMRVRLDTPILQDDGNSNDDEKVLGDVLSTYSTTLDMRIAWGPTTPRLPGE